MISRLVLLATLLPLTALAQTNNPHCLAEFEAESARIQREAGARAPAPGSDPATQQRFMQGVYTQLEAAAARARACDEAARPRPGSPAAQAEAARYQQCRDAANRAFERIRLPAQATFEQQRAYREAETRILDTMRDCERKIR